MVAAYCGCSVKHAGTDGGLTAVQRNSVLRITSEVRRILSDPPPPPQKKRKKAGFYLLATSSCTEQLWVSSYFLLTLCVQ